MIDAVAAERVARFAEAKRIALELLRDFDEAEHPRDRDGKFTDKPETGGGGPAPKPAEAKPVPSDKKGKKPADIADFAKDSVTVDTATISDPAKQKKFVDTWNAYVGEAPAEFRNEFLGGQNGTMSIHYTDYDEAITVSGFLLDAEGNKIGEYRRSIDFDDKEAASDYFKMFGGKQDAGHGKTMLGANVAMYQKLGMNKVEVHANIDVGGYAWARYGYVPTEGSWGELSYKINRNIDRLTGGGGGGEGYTADSWEELGQHQQDEIERAFIDQTRDEFIESEVENWRESGQALESAKTTLVEQFNNGEETAWATHAIDGYRKTLSDAGKPDIPFSNETLIQAITLDYSSRYDDGKGDLDVTFNDDKLTNPTGVDPAQETLPGIPAVEPHEHLTESMRDGLTKALDKMFENRAESDAGDADPPDYIGDNVAELQSEVWSSYSDRDKYKWAQRNADEHLTTEGEPIEGTGEMDEADADRLRRLANSDDPKAVWAIADSAWGKELLLDTDWYGVIDFSDKETMNRFNAYIAKGKK